MAEPGSCAESSTVPMLDWQTDVDSSKVVEDGEKLVHLSGSLVPSFSTINQ